MSTKALEAPTMLLEEGAATNALCTAFVCNIAILEKIVHHPELRKGLCTYPTLVCEDCKASTPIVSSYAGEIHRHAVNLRSSLAKVAIGESHSSFETFCCLRGGGGRYHFCIIFFVLYIYIYIYNFVPPCLF